MTPAQHLDALTAIAREAGAKIMEIYDSGALQVETKDDDSPVTAADAAAEDVILKGLAALDAETPVLAEEAASAGRIPDLGARFYCVDPLDGTKEFIRGTDEFTVNIALVENGKPVMGVVYAPACDKLYAGAAGEGALMEDADGRRAIAVRTAPAALTAVASKSHRTPETNALLEEMNVADTRAAGSSLKFCLVAAGEADVYPRLGRTMEWDTAAGQAVLEAAGGRVVAHPDGGPLRYGKADRGFDNPHFIADSKSS